MQHNLLWQYGFTKIAIVVNIFFTVKLSTPSWQKWLSSREGHQFSYRKMSQILSLCTEKLEALIKGHALNHVGNVFICTANTVN